MSSAFVKESESQRLNEVEPNLSALKLYLRRDNGGVPVHETKTYYSDKHGRDVYEMSDGLTYAIKEGKWYIILD